VSPAQAQRTVVLVMRGLVIAFGVSGILFLLVPDTVISTLDDVGDAIGGFSDGAASEQKLWVALSFAYMVVITGIAAVVSTDVIRYRPLILVLAAGKVASSVPALAFFLFHRDDFAYVVTFLVDGSLVGVTIACWVLAGRVRPAVPA
jgi:hypothetical protein